VRACVFDVNETLLDNAALDPLFTRIFGDAAVRREWFTQMLQCAFVGTITRAYVTFGDAGEAALRMTAASHGVELADEEPDALRDAMRRLPAHPDARDGLERLRDAGVRLATLTNSTAEVGAAQLEHAGLMDLFEQTLSADDVRRLKPAPEPYAMAARSLQLSIDQTRLVAAHAWDVAGALRAGCAAAFIARPGRTLDPLSPAPDVIASDLREAAEAILERERLEEVGRASGGAG
jgi:2-haloacid dehalogenase